MRRGRRWRRFDRDADTYTDAGTHGDSNADAYFHPVADGYADSYPDANSHAYPDSDTDADADAYAYAYAYR